MKTDLCQCGSMHDAVDRAFNTITKMETDNECVIFQIAVGMSITSIATGLLGLGIQEDDSQSELNRAIAESHRTAEELRNALMNYINRDDNKDRLGDRMNELATLHNDILDAKGDLAND